MTGSRRARVGAGGVALIALLLALFPVAAHATVARPAAYHQPLQHRHVVPAAAAALPQGEASATSPHALAPTATATQRDARQVGSMPTSAGSVERAVTTPRTRGPPAS